MRYIKSFNESIQYPTDPEAIREILREIAPPKGSSVNHHILDRIKIQPDGTVDVTEGGIRLYLENKYDRIPVKFGYVEEIFDLRSNFKLTDLQGSPYNCGEFRCEKLVHLKSLVGGPKIVRGDFDAEFCSLTSLEGSPEEVGGYYDVSTSDITSLMGSPKTVGGNFLARGVHLTDLVGGPRVVESHYIVASRGLTSLEGAPKRVGQELDLRNANYELWDPRPLKDCEIGYIGCAESSLHYLLELFRESNDSRKDTENFLLSLDYNYVRSERTINLFRVKEAISEILGDGVKPSIIGRLGNLPLWEFVNDEGEYVNFDGQRIDLDGNPIRF